ncbi:MAG TPA: ankyrin repeat domain-containing protein, partial [Woeseiaceae bacterium]|nr:ankyrin repeat domain-containing protein [Woeseiaceae bacterium]
MSKLPARPSLASLRRQAKSLLNRFREKHSEALATIREHHPKPDRFSTLRDAQLVVARQYGYAGWAELRAAVANALDAACSTDELAEQFTDLACLCYSEEEHVNRRQRAAGLLAEKPELAAASIFAAAAAFDVAALRAHLDKHPARANQVGGPRAWPPLMYLGYSRVPEAPPARDAVDAARLLLRHGANARFYVDGSHGWGGWRWTTLTGVIGEGESGCVNQPPHPRARELAEILLDAGADPNDSQGLYNCHFSPSNEWLELLLSRGLTADAPVNPDNPAEESTLNFLLAQAVRAGLIDRVRLLLAHGADASGRDRRYTHRTYVSNAVLSGHGNVLDLLVAHGAPRPGLSMEDRFRMAVVGGEADEAKRLMFEDPGLSRQPDLLVQLAQTNRPDAARLLLDLGADPNAMATDGRGALHEAAWAGHREMIELLLDRGARLDVRSRAHGGTPVGYAHHAGRSAVRDFLLERSRDVFDLVAFGWTERLISVLEEEPRLVERIRNDGATLMAAAK